MAKFLGVDTGGTFTDFILFDDESKTIRIHKVLSTPQSPEKAIKNINRRGAETQRKPFLYLATPQA